MYIPADLRTPDSAPAAAQKIYATHAAGKDVAQLLSLLIRLEAILIDIRLAPSAQPLKWSKTYLKLLLKNKYLHVPTLGNRTAEGRSYTGKPAIHNLALGIKIITDLKINLVLFCACENEKTCHRRVIIRELAKQGREVLEIEDWNAASLKPEISDAGL